jgi:hypothetical protein
VNLLGSSKPSAYVLVTMARLAGTPAPRRSDGGGWLPVERRLLTLAARMIDTSSRAEEPAWLSEHKAR